MNQKCNAYDDSMQAHQREIQALILPNNIIRGTSRVLPVMVCA